MSETDTLVWPLLKQLSHIERATGGRCMFWRQHGGGGKRDGYLIRSGRKGMPDVAGVVDGRSVWGEAKLPGEKASPEQLEMHRQLRRAGALVFLYETKEEFLCEVELLLNARIGSSR